MAKAGKNNNPSKAGSSNWLSLEDVFQRWCDRLGSSTDAKDELEALLCDRETRSAKQRVKRSGKEIPGTSSFADDPEFWRDRLLLEPDADGGPDRLMVDYTDAADIYLPAGHWEFYVRALDVERWEKRLGSGNNVISDYSPIQLFEQEMEGQPRTPPRLYPMTAAPPSTAAEPAVSEVATQDVSRGAQGVDGADGRPTTINSSTVTADRKRRQSIKETRVLEVLRDLDSKCRVQDDMQPAEVEKIVRPLYVPLYGEVSRRTIYRAYKIFLNEPPEK